MQDMIIYTVHLSCKEEKQKGKVWQCTDIICAALPVKWTMISIKQCQRVANKKGEASMKKKAMRKLTITIYIYNQKQFFQNDML